MKGNIKHKNNSIDGFNSKTEKSAYFNIFTMFASVILCLGIIFFLSLNFTGNSIFDNFHEDTLNKEYTDNRILLWTPLNDISIGSLSISGNVEGTGRLTNYLVYGDEIKLINSIIINDENVILDSVCINTCVLDNIKYEKYLIKTEIIGNLVFNLDSITYSEKKRIQNYSEMSLSHLEFETSSFFENKSRISISDDFYNVMGISKMGIRFGNLTPLNDSLLIQQNFLLDLNISQGANKIIYNLYGLGNQLVGQYHSLPNPYPDNRNFGWVDMTKNVVLYHFDNDILNGESSTTIRDYSGNGYDAYVKDALYRSSGIVNGSIKFVKHNSNVLNVSKRFLLDQDFTISSWVKFEMASGEQFIIRDNAGGSFEEQNGYIFSVYPYNDRLDLRYFSRCNQNHAGQRLTTTVNGNYLNEWHMISVSKNSTEIKFYFNGKEVSKLNLGGSKICYDDFSKTLIGLNLGGQMDEFSIWNRTLSKSEMRNLYSLNLEYKHNFTNLSYGSYNYDIRVLDHDGIISNTQTRRVTLESEITEVFMDVDYGVFLEGIGINIPYSFLHNISVTNRGNGRMLNVSKIYPINIDPKVESVVLINSNCNRNILKVGELCVDTFNITLKALTSPLLGNVPQSIVDFKINWTENNRSITTEEGHLDVVLATNPVLRVNPVTIFGKHGHNYTVQIFVESVGSVSVKFVNLTYDNFSIPREWMYLERTIDSITQIDNIDLGTISTSKSVDIRLSIPKYADPGTYIGSVLVKGRDAKKINQNITVVVLENKSWYVEQDLIQISSLTTTDEPVTVEKVIGNITIFNTGNTQMNFSLDYTEHNYGGISTYPFNLEPGLCYFSCLGFNLDYKLRDNPYPKLNPGNNLKTIIVPKNSSSNFVIVVDDLYMNYVSLDVGINVTISDPTAAPSFRNVALKFNITNPPPVLRRVEVIPSKYVGLNENLEIRALVSDDKALNLDSAYFEISNSLFTYIINESNGLIIEDVTSSYDSTDTKLLKTNFSQTTINGMYDLIVNVKNSAEKTLSQNLFNFHVERKTSLIGNSNQSKFNITGINFNRTKNVLIEVNATNVGNIYAYNSSFNSYLPSGWTVENIIVGKLEPSKFKIEILNITLPKNTAPGNYTLKPYIVWKNSDLTYSSFNLSSINFLVSSNKVSKFTNKKTSFTIEHGVKNKSNIFVTSIGNDQISNVNLNLIDVPNDFDVSLNQTNIQSINAGMSKKIQLLITPKFGIAHGNTYSFNISVANDQLGIKDNYKVNVIVPTSVNWNLTAHHITIQAINGQNVINDEIKIHNLANIPMAFDYILTGNVTENNIMTLIPKIGGLLNGRNRTIELNYTSQRENSIRNGVLSVNNGFKTEHVNITFESYIASLEILNITPWDQIEVKNKINITTALVFVDPIVDNIFYEVQIGGYDCLVTDTTIDGNNVIITLEAPSEPLDSSWHDVKVIANYNNGGNMIRIFQIKERGLFYKDSNNPSASNLIAENTHKGNDFFISVDITDNSNEINEVIAEIIHPNGTAINYTLDNISSITYTKSLNTITELIDEGIYHIQIHAIDRSLNINNSLSKYFDVFYYKTLSGRLIGLNGRPILVDFNLVNINNEYNFSSNNTGHYNKTIKKLNYDLKISFWNYQITQNDVSFHILPNHFIEIDELEPSDVDVSGGIMGFSVKTNLTSKGTIKIDYDGRPIIRENNLRLYKCSDWSYSIRYCNSKWEIISSEFNVDRINNHLIVDLDEFSKGTAAYMLAEIPVANEPDLRILDPNLNYIMNHSSSKSLIIKIESVGGIALTNVQGYCERGVVCDDFIVTYQRISEIQVGDKDDFFIRIEVPAYYPAGHHTGRFIITSKTVTEPVFLNVEVLSEISYKHNLTNYIVHAGGNSKGQIGNLYLENSGNNPIIFNISVNGTEINVSNKVDLGVGVSKNLTINFTAPSDLGLYIYNLTFNKHSELLKINVTDSIKILGINKTRNLFYGDIIKINASLNNSKSHISSGVLWNVKINKFNCEGLTSNLIGTIWELKCMVPFIDSGSEAHLFLEGINSGTKSYDSKRVYYRDGSGPSLVDYTSNSIYDGSLTLISAKFTDPANVSKVNVSVQTPSGNIIVPENISLNFGILNIIVNLTELGDYIITYSAYDGFDNLETYVTSFELYQKIILSGNIYGENSSNFNNLTISLYRWEDDESPVEFNTDNEGNFVFFSHNRTYSKVILNLRDIIIELNDVNITEFVDNFNIYAINKSLFNFSNYDSILGLAVDTSRNYTGKLRLHFNPSLVSSNSELVVLKCSEWDYMNHVCQNGNQWIKFPYLKYEDYVEFSVFGFSSYVLVEDKSDKSTSAPISTPSSGGGGGGGGGSSGSSGTSLANLLEGFKFNDGIELSDLIYVLNDKVGPESYMGKKIQESVDKFSKKFNDEISKENDATIRIIPLQSRITPGDILKVQTEILHPLKSETHFDLSISVIRTNLNKEILSQSKDFIIDSNIIELIEIKIPEDTIYDVYFVRFILTWVNSDGEIRQTMDSAPFYVQKTLTERFSDVAKINFGFVSLWQIFIALIISLLLGYVYYKYKKYVESRKRYKIPYDLKQLPGPGPRSGFIGSLAETRIRAFFELDKLTTHTLVAGSTGGGKTVSAQVLIEEALKKGIAVVVFDPTAQWTGFLRKCVDKKMIHAYKDYSMRRSEAMAFNGNVHLVKNSREVIDIKKIVKPGEIDIFALNKIDLKEMDIFVTNTVRQIFKSNFEESPELKILLVYDEVHRLLPKFGGSGAGFLQIERACREFRKWGLGMILISQVLSDFKGEIKANINTEIQVRTRVQSDLDRVKERYGDEMLRSLVKASVGTGMLQNSEYNRGRPYMISYRPLLHSTERLSDKELEEYEHYNNIVKDINFELEQLKEFGQDTFNLEIELNLALSKLKSGDFNVVKIYLEGLRPRIADVWKSIKKSPKKRQIQLVSEKEIKDFIALAEKEHKKIDEKFSKKDNPEKKELLIKSNEELNSEIDGEEKKPNQKNKNDSEDEAEESDKEDKKEKKDLESENKIKDEINKILKDFKDKPKDYKEMKNRLSKVKSLIQKNKLSNAQKFKVVSLEGDLYIANKTKNKKKLEEISGALNKVLSKL